MPDKSLIPAERIEQSILLIRGEKVMLDADLATLYDVPTRRLNEQVKRNIERFPSDFMFQLTKQELENWRSHFAISNPAAKMSLRRRPYAFTEHGILMLSSVLKSKRAAQVNVEIMRTFVRLRRMIASSKHLAQRLDQLENKYDKRFKIIFDAIRQLMTPPDPNTRDQDMGFRLPKKAKK